MNILIIILGKLLTKISKLLNLGNGSTWPGHIALKMNKNFTSEIIKNSKTKTIFITGTNGKTTTGRLIKTMLEYKNKKVFQNESGANLINGIASSVISNCNLFGKLNYDFAIFEIDENTFPLISEKINPDFLIALNLFRDQLDRYGEIDYISKNWRITYDKLPEKTVFILNADDPQIAYLGTNLKNVIYFGLNEPSSETLKYSADSFFCPNCGYNLSFKTVYFSHLGDWSCENCKLKRPEINTHDSPIYPLTGTYNKYNTLASIALCRYLGIKDEEIKKALRNFIPAFGRQEKITVNGKEIQIFLSKNPTSFNESLRTIKKAKSILLVLNDRIPDGRDVSWIWDINFENLLYASKITVSGDRSYDMAIRLKYADKKHQVFNNLKDAIKNSLSNLSENETLYILPTYSAMLEVRKIITGRKIL